MGVGLGSLPSSAALLTADLFRSSHLPLKPLLLSSISPSRIPARPPPPSCRALATALSAMAFNYKPEDARVTPTLQLPTPPSPRSVFANLAVTADKERNITHACKAIEEAAGRGQSSSSCPLQIMIVGGSIPERSGDHLYNSCCVFGANEKLKGKHRKVQYVKSSDASYISYSALYETRIHLFDIDILGKITFKELKALTAGEGPTIVDTDVGHIGIGICYDIRFQELAMLYAARGAHLLCYPVVFSMTTSPLHWELLQRARAADNQFGEVVATPEHEEAIIVEEIDLSLIELRRSNLPPEKQHRGVLYQLADVQRLNS